MTPLSQSSHNGISFATSIESFLPHVLSHLLREYILLVGSKLGVVEAYGHNAKLQNSRTKRRLRERYTFLSVSLFDITLYSLLLLLLLYMTNTLAK